MEGYLDTLEKYKKVYYESFNISKIHFVKVNALKLNNSNFTKKL
jgi:hypothetical protein